jgi:nicotinate (nicotinamide) nucleotide adenylyltransferase
MELIVPPQTTPKRLGILAGSFNPPTRAHVALARAALSAVDNVLFVLPRLFPHKPYEGASLDERVSMLRTVTSCEPRLSAAVSVQGLFIEIAHEAREHFPSSSLFFICGRDAADRIVNWNYGEPGAIERMLEDFHLLVAPRQGVYTPPAHLSQAVHRLALEDYDECSSSHVREAIRAGSGWKHLVPEEIAGAVEQIYR